MKEQYQHEGSDYLLSLTKLTGKKIKDVVGYVSNEFGDPTFKLSHIVMEDDKPLFIEGEHDFPYVCGVDEKILEDIYNEDEENGDNE